MIGSPLLLLFTNEYADTIIVVADEVLYGCTITDAVRYGITITDTMPYSIVIGDAAVYGATVTGASLYGCTITDALLTGDTPVAYDIGDVARLSVAFADPAGVADDPTEVTLRIKLPTGSISALVYNGGAGDVVRDSAGNYHYDLTLMHDGTYYYKFEGTGDVVAAEETSLDVQSSVFDESD